MGESSSQWSPSASPRMASRVLGERLRQRPERQSIREGPNVFEGFAGSRRKYAPRLRAGRRAAKSLSTRRKLKRRVAEAADAAPLAQTIAWTPAMRRLFALVEGCMNHKEPALLVPETGCGKTSVCQLLALLRGQKLRILNCHQHTETSDFIGGFRPTRTAERHEMMEAERQPRRSRGGRRSAHQSHARR